MGFAKFCERHCICIVAGSIKYHLNCWKWPRPWTNSPTLKQHWVNGVTCKQSVSKWLQRLMWAAGGIASVQCMARSPCWWETLEMQNWSGFHSYWIDRLIIVFDSPANVACNSSFHSSLMKDEWVSKVQSVLQIEIERSGKQKLWRTGGAKSDYKGKIG